MKKELNEYLFYEFGYDANEGDTGKVRDDWPFVLEEAGTIEVRTNKEHVFTFEHEGERFYAIYGSVLDFFPLAGMDLTNLCRQFLGKVWIADKKPINLEEVRFGEPIVPKTAEIKKRIEELAKAIDSERPVKILEGLFLESTREYLGLVQFGDDDRAHIVGDRVRIRNIPFKEASPWRRIAVGIGKLVEEGKL